jgi:hypothetical protein
MGIIANHGMSVPATRTVAMVFARGTPYETRLEYRPAAPQRVLPVELARVVRDALIDVIEDGTARRLAGAFETRDGRAIEPGGQ